MIPPLRGKQLAALRAIAATPGELRITAYLIVMWWGAAHGDHKSEGEVYEGVLDSSHGRDTVLGTKVVVTGRSSGQ